MREDLILNNTSVVPDIHALHGHRGYFSHEYPTQRICNAGIDADEVELEARGRETRAVQPQGGGEGGEGKGCGGARGEIVREGRRGNRADALWQDFDESRGVHGLHAEGEGDGGKE
jgi:hypothetical protein